MKERVKNLLPVLGLGVISFFSQVSMSTQNGLTLSSSDISSIEGSVFTWAGSIFNVIVSLGGLIIGIIAIGLILRYVFRR